MNRELSWMEFNQRVLSEASRSDLPLLERLKFLAISASNLDEFFQVRVGSLIRMRRSRRNVSDASGLTPTANLTAIRDRTLRMMEDQYSLLNREILPAMESQGIQILHAKNLDGERKTHMAAVFDETIFPLLTPLAIEEAAPPPTLPALNLIIACRLLDPDLQSTRYALIPIPDSLPRCVPLPVDAHDRYECVLIEDLISSHLAALFPGENVMAATHFRVTRNGDIAIQEEDAIDLAGEMEDVLSARRFADTVRLELALEAPRDLVSMIRRVTSAGTNETLRPEGPLGLAAFMDLAFLEGFDHLRDEDWPGQNSPSLIPGASMFETIAAGDLLLHHPYESFEPVLRFIEEAAEDPDVIAIKQVLYRTAKKSRIIDALIRAAENGKHVTALVELKARFDEARNLDRADELQRAGVQIVYGVKNLKTHAKICLVVRREEGRLRRYVHLGTGNYNESTARLYTDLSYLTCKADYGNDASLFFNAVTGRSKLVKFQRLIPAPTAMKAQLIELITGEADRAKQGLPARITAKINSLQDQEIIKALYQASRAGVEIRLNVRGICCLKPNDAKYSKNIHVVSIIDRFLEHARLFHFHHGGDPRVFIASADWMTRNLDKRIELMIPIEEPSLQRRLIRTLDCYFKDNSQAFLIHSDGTSGKLPRPKGVKAFRAQEHFHNEAKRAAKAREHERAMTFEPHIPSHHAIL